MRILSPLRACHHLYKTRNPFNDRIRHSSNSVLKREPYRALAPLSFLGSFSYPHTVSIISILIDGSEAFEIFLIAQIHLFKFAGCHAGLASLPDSNGVD